MTDQDFAALVQVLTESRDEAFIDANNAPRSHREHALGRWSGFALALSHLHIWSHGEYGVAYQSQPSPFATTREGCA